MDTEKDSDLCLGTLHWNAEKDPKTNKYLCPYPFSVTDKKTLDNIRQLLEEAEAKGEDTLSIDFHFPVIDELSEEGKPRDKAVETLCWSTKAWHYFLEDLTSAEDYKQLLLEAKEMLDNLGGIQAETIKKAELAEKEAEAARKEAAEAKKAKEEAEKAKKKAEKEKRRAEESLKALSKGEMKNFYNMPTSSATNLIMDTLTSGKDVASLPERKTTNRNSYEVMAKGDARQIILSSKKGTITLEINDINKLDIKGRAEKSLFALALIKANDQAIHNGEIIKDAVTFPLQELVDLGLYTSIDAARRGFASSMRALTSLKVNGKIEDTKKKVITQDAIAVLFTGAERKNGQCSIYLNPRINWKFIIKYFAPLPYYYFALPLKPQDLLYYICYLARQRTKEIANFGFFNISMRAIQRQLNLPDERGAKNPGRDILEPIEKAVELILEKGAEDFDLELVYDKSKASIAEILKHGYLKITPLGDIKGQLTCFSMAVEKRIDTARKRKEKIADTARAMHLKDKLKEEKEA